MDGDPSPDLALRARGKARRHAEVVAAAARLWREHGMEKVSLAQIAAAAEVAPQTIYNLIGGLDAVALAVMKLALDQLEAALLHTTATGIDLALEAARMSAQIHIDDADLYRQVLVRVPRLLFEGGALGLDTAAPVIGAMMQAQAAGQISLQVDADRLGRAIHSNYLGGIYDWACGDASDAVFLATSEIAVLAPLVACATDAARPALAARLFDRLSSGPTLSAGRAR